MQRKDGKDEDGEKLKNWLDSIEQESWQLELLISGFAIFLLLAAKGPLWELEYDLLLLQQSSEQFFTIDILYYGARMAYTAVTACLILQVVVRGLWVAAIGLRSVSGDIEYENFRFQPFFKDRLQRRIGSFDSYIERLEKYCSTLFSFAFLVFFCFFGLAFFLVATAFFAQGASWLLTDQEEGLGWMLTNILSFLLLLFGAVYAIDFITLGYLKRWKWWGKSYYYFYIFMGWITLARFYRPLYYNLIDNSFGRVFARALPLSILLLVFLASLRFSGKTFIPGFLQDGSTWISSNSYEDQVLDRTRMIWSESLASRYAHNNYVDLFAPYIPINDDELLRLINPDITPGRSAGAYLEGGINIGSRNLSNADNQVMLAAFRAKYRLYINDSLIEVAPRFYFHPTRRQHGVLYPIPVHSLPLGEHRLRLDYREFRKDSVSFGRGTTIYFYK